MAYMGTSEKLRDPAHETSAPDEHVFQGDLNQFQRTSLLFYDTATSKMTRYLTLETRASSPPASCRSTRKSAEEPRGPYVMRQGHDVM